MANLYGKPQGFLEDYSGIAAAGSAFQGFMQGMQAAEDRKYKQMEFESKVNAQKAEQERHAAELAIKKRKESPEYIQRQERNELIKSGIQPTYDEFGEISKYEYTPEYLKLQEEKAKADPYGLKATAATNAKLETEKKKGDIAKDKRDAARVSKSPVPGYNKVDDSEIDVASARQLKEAAGDVKKFQDQMSALEVAVRNANEKQLANPLSDVSKDIKNKLRELQLLYKSKSFAELGVLTGPDLKLLEEVIENPGSISNLISGKQGVLSRYEQVKQRVRNNFDARAEAFGLVSQGLVKDGMIKGPSAPTAPMMDAAARDKRIKELEAKAAEGAR